MDISLLSPEELKKRHLEIIRENDWRENDESMEIARQFRKLPVEIVGECMECGGKAKITCQYH